MEDLMDIDPRLIDFDILPMLDSVKPAPNPSPGPHVAEQQQTQPLEMNTEPLQSPTVSPSSVPRVKKTKRTLSAIKTQQAVESPEGRPVRAPRQSKKVKPPVVKSRALLSFIQKHTGQELLPATAKVEEATEQNMTIDLTQKRSPRSSPKTKVTDRELMPPPKPGGLLAPKSATKDSRNFHRFTPTGSLMFGLPWNPVTIQIDGKHPKAPAFFNLLKQKYMVVNHTLVKRSGPKIASSVSKQLVEAEIDRWFLLHPGNEQTDTTPIVAQPVDTNTIQQRELYTFPCHVKELPDGGIHVFFDGCTSLIAMKKSMIFNYDTLQWKLPWNEEHQRHMVPVTPTDTYTERKPDEAIEGVRVCEQRKQRVFLCGSIDCDEDCYESLFINVRPVTDMDQFNDQLSKHNIPIPMVEKLLTDIVDSTTIKLVVLKKNLREIIEGLSELGYQVTHQLVKKRSMDIGYMNLKDLDRAALAFMKKHNNRPPKDEVNRLKHPIWGAVMRLLRQHKKIANDAWPLIEKLICDKGPVLSESQTVQLYDAFFWTTIAEEENRRPEYQVIVDWYNDHGRPVRLKKPYERTGTSINRAPGTNPRRFKGLRKAIYSKDNSPYLQKGPDGRYIAAKRTRKKISRGYKSKGSARGAIGALTNVLKEIYDRRSQVDPSEDPRIRDMELAIQMFDEIHGNLECIDSEDIDNNFETGVGQTTGASSHLDDLFDEGQFESVEDDDPNHFDAAQETNFPNVHGDNNIQDLMEQGGQDDDVAGSVSTRALTPYDLMSDEEFNSLLLNDPEMALLTDEEEAQKLAIHEKKEKLERYRKAIMQQRKKHLKKCGPVEKMNDDELRILDGLKKAIAAIEHEIRIPKGRITNLNKKRRKLAETVSQ